MSISQIGALAEREPPDHLSAASELARTLFGTARDALLVVEPTSERLLDANPMAESLSRLPRDHLLGLHLRELISRDGADDDWLDRLHQATAFHGESGFVLRAVDPMVRIPVALSIARLEVPQGAPLALLTLRDRRDEVETCRRVQGLEAELRATRFDDSHKQESLRVLAGGVAHDFNNLLTGILGNAGLARLACPDGSPLVAALEQIENIAVRAADLCKQMLAYAGRTPLLLHPVDLTAVVRETTDLMRQPLARKAEVHLDLAEDLPQVNADENQLRHIVINLLLNAWEALGAGPNRIRVRTGRTQFQLPEASAERPRTTPDPYFFPAGDLTEGDYLFFEVEDTGVGIPEEMRGRIFEPFFTTKFTGRGLGLAAVLGIVRSHQGGIQMASEVGKGSTFRVLLRKP